MKKKDGFGHEKPNEGKTNDWITPKWVIDAFDNLATEGMFFDLDPCISRTQPWLTARKGYSADQDGLAQSWWGMVYCNPPYGPHVGAWTHKMLQHNNGIMLIFARVETRVWQRFIFPTCSGVLFPDKRISFYRPDGTIGTSAGAPSAFISWGQDAKKALITLCKSGAISGSFNTVNCYTR